MQTKRSKAFKKKKRDDEVEAVVLGEHGGDVYSLELEDGREVKGKRSGKMRQNKINILTGDRVRVLLDPYGGNATNRITYRL